MKRLLMLLSLIVSGCSQNSPMNMPLFQSNTEHNEDCLNMRRFKVLQVLEFNHALAYECNGGELCVLNPIVLLTPMRGVDYYDDMMVTVPADKCAVQYGTYKYETKKKIVKTVPRIAFEYEYSASSEEELAKRFYESMDDLRYECKLSLTEEKKYNTKANMKKCDCSVDYLTKAAVSIKSGKEPEPDMKKKMEKKCGRVPGGFWD